MKLLVAVGAVVGFAHAEQVDLVWGQMDTDVMGIQRVTGPSSADPGEEITLSIEYADAGGFSDVNLYVETFSWHTKWDTQYATDPHCDAGVCEFNYTLPVIPVQYEDVSDVTMNLWFSKNAGDGATLMIDVPLNPSPAHVPPAPAPAPVPTITYELFQCEPFTDDDAWSTSTDKSQSASRSWSSSGSSSSGSGSGSEFRDDDPVGVLTVMGPASLAQGDNSQFLVKADPVAATGQDFGATLYLTYDHVPITTKYMSSCEEAGGDKCPVEEGAPVMFTIDSYTLASVPDKLHNVTMQLGLYTGEGEGSCVAWEVAVSS